MNASLPSHIDAVIIGAGSGGMSCAETLAARKKSVVLVERERVGGECPYWACVPSKTLLRSTQPAKDELVVPGSHSACSGDVDFSAAKQWRTQMVNDYSDLKRVSEILREGVSIVRGEAAITGPGSVRIGSEVLRCDAIVVATGSRAGMPHIAGIEDVPVWTSREATSANEVPSRLTILGGGAVGLEMAQVFARYGSQVTVVESAPRVLGNEAEAAARALTDALEAEGVRIRTAARATRVATDKEGSIVTSFDDGEPIVSERLLVATGRQPVTDGLGVESAGGRLDKLGFLEIDSRCRAAEGLYGVGDVTGKPAFTHVAKYQGRVAALNICGEELHASYDAVPRCLFTSPEAAFVGIGEDEAERRGLHYRVAHADANDIVRPFTHSTPHAPCDVELIADMTSNTLIGGWMIGPMASECIGFVTAAIRTRAPLDALVDVIQAYPTFSEAWYVALDRIVYAGVTPVVA